MLEFRKTDGRLAKLMEDSDRLLVEIKKMPRDELAAEAQSLLLRLRVLDRAYASLAEEFGRDGSVLAASQAHVAVQEQKWIRDMIASVGELSGQEDIMAKTERICMRTRLSHAFEKREAGA